MSKNAKKIVVNDAEVNLTTIQNDQLKLIGKENKVQIY